MRTLAALATIALLVGVSLPTAVAAARSNAQPTASSSRRIDDGRTSVLQLRGRPLALRSLDSGDRCPSAKPDSDVPEVGRGITAGPVTLIGPEDDGLAYVDYAESWNPASLLWLVRAEEAEPVIVRAMRLDRPGVVTFAGRERDMQLFGFGTTTVPKEWRVTPGEVGIPKPGCYGFQIDGPTFQSTIVVRTHPIRTSYQHDPIAVPSVRTHGLSDHIDGKKWRDLWRNTPGSAENKCVRATGVNALRSGEFIAGPMLFYPYMWNAENPRMSSKMYWQPLHPGEMPPLAVTVESLDPAQPGVFTYRFAHPAYSVPGSFPFYPSATVIPHRGPWRLTAEAGPNRGCFELTI